MYLSEVKYSLIIFSQKQRHTVIRVSVAKSLCPLHKEKKNCFLVSKSYRNTQNKASCTFRGKHFANISMNMGFTDLQIRLFCTINNGCYFVLPITWPNNNNKTV